MSKFRFYLTSFTWGLPLTLVGCVVAWILCMVGYRPKKYGHCYYFEIGESWGGCNFGVVFITYKNSDTHIKNHEHGHAIQNCYFGVLTPFIVAIPSVIRYWYRRLVPGAENTPYDGIWFEGQATRWGNEFMNNF